MILLLCPMLCLISEYTDSYPEFRLVAELSGPEDIRDLHWFKPDGAGVGQLSKELGLEPAQIFQLVLTQRQIKDLLATIQPPTLSPEDAERITKEMDGISKHFLEDPEQNYQTATSQLQELLSESAVDVNCIVALTFITFPLFQNSLFIAPFPFMSHSMGECTTFLLYRQYS